ncbi:MAG: acyl-ACP--UDP-N-acetylglucosamine O-acyltransferase [Bacteroidales bacterium]|jgi:UDP-N-acetylglucosamine acyltransferase|nr:acyl-ACP--UDP-N-acetylglucosamine O-acyltransferase [Bacteroidales bacterium]MCI2121351.1 acyl-ACP--UDP-N-acetylglucosamine O-acyltransferase [Bacteroidales bacterium]MCI2145248.1 acyl-ACP--UDP-N-acetylglucosamine O-acyltransferase [Bacteroidales bacterium]
MERFIDPGARIGKNVKIGPFCYISANVEIGDGTIVEPGAIIYDYVKIGKDCHVFPGAVIGAIPQDLKYDGETTYVEIGDRTTIRECATINRGTKARGVTKIGDDALIMSYVHVAHDCHVGNRCILTSYVGIAGETDVDDWAIIGGGTVVHQFSKIGTHAMVGGSCGVNKDVPPYALAANMPFSFEGINTVGLRRRGFTFDQIEEIKAIYKVIYESSATVADACSIAEQQFPDSQFCKTITSFIRSSKRGIVRSGFVYPSEV